MSAALEVARVRLGARPDAATVDALHALERAVEARPWSRAMLVDELAAAGRAWIVAGPADAPIAFAGSARLGDDVHVLRLTVAEPHRRRGIGRALLGDLVAVARSEGAASVTLEVRAGNTAALALYRATGFVERGRREGYYADGEDALLLTLDLGSVADTGDAQRGG